MITRVGSTGVENSPTGSSRSNSPTEVFLVPGEQGQGKLAELVGFGIVNIAGKSEYNPIALDAAWWYGMDIKEVPFPLYVMLAEEDPGRRVQMWNKVKATP